MKFFVSIVVTALLSFATCLFMPWWIIAVAAFVVAFFIPQTNGKAFVAGFVALFLLWVGICFFISNANDNIMAHKMSLLFIKIDNPFLLIVVTGIVGGLVAGFAALSGCMCKKLFTNDN